MAGLKNLAKRATLGVTPNSPQKRRKKKNSQPVDLGIQTLRLESLKRRLELMSSSQPPAKPTSQTQPTSESLPTLQTENSDVSCTQANSEVPDVDMEPCNTPDLYFHDDGGALPPPSACSPVKRSRKEEEEDRNSRWNETLRTLVDPLMGYWDRVVGKYPEEVTQPPVNPCSSGSCVVEVASVQAIYFNHHRKKDFRYCRCQTLAQVLVAHGLFPTSPSQPRMAIALDLLDFYSTLCQQSSDAVTALANALSSLYRRQGFRLLGTTGEALQDPVHRALGNSLQWYDTLVVEVDRYVTAKIDNLKKRLPLLLIPATSRTSSLATSPAYALLPQPPSPDLRPSATSESSASSREPAPHPQSPDIRPSAVSESSASSEEPAPHPQSPDVQPSAASECSTSSEEQPPASTGSGSPQPPFEGSCDPYLQRLCPACFGGKRFGQSFQWGGDLHVALDGNLHHRHLKSGGDGVPFHQSTRFLSKEFVDEVGARVAAARGQPPRQRRSTKLPDDVVDADQDSYKAASGDSKRQSNDAFDENGVMALVCRHDIPLFLASIDTPGEQQKYAIALFEAFFAMIPDCATVAGLYDIACVLDRSLDLYDLLPEGVASRLQLATAVMHAYGHQWACQLLYNPRMRVGLGITDGEGTERLWSRLRRIIGLERRASRAKRRWMLDRQCDSIAMDLREGLGGWIRRRLHKNVQKKEAEAVKTIRKMDVTLVQLRRYWSEQKDAQSSVRALAPARLKKELTKVLQLQAQIDTLEEEITEVNVTIKKMPFAPSEATFSLRNMEQLHAKLKLEAEGLYTSLNIDHQFPELKDIPLEYLHTLLLARDLKLTIRKKAIGTFYEWDRVDGAVGGVNEALGTRLHQITRNSISRRAAAFETLIRKFNQHITYLEENHKPSYQVPVPSRLPTQLQSLRDMETSHLWEDVWISKTETPPKWLVDEDIRRGIRSFLNLDRCAEERARLNTEATNLLSWFTHELQVLMFMTRNPQYARYQTLLNSRLQEHLLLAGSWSNPFLPATSFRNQVTAVEQWASQFSLANLSTSSLSPLPSPPTSLSLAPVLLPAPTAHPPAPTSHPPAPTSHPPAPTSHPPVPTAEPPAPMALPHMLQVNHVREPSGIYEDQDNEEEDEIEITGERLALTDVIIDCEPDESEDTMALEWTALAPLRVDIVLWPGIKGHRFPAFDCTSQAERSFRNLAGVQYVFGPSQYRRLDGATQWLDDECINGCGALLERNFRVSDLDCSLFSTYIVHEVLRNSTRTETAWRIASPTRFWTKPVWILPIHDNDEHHWALAIVRVEEEQIQLFDSFGSREFISRWLPRIQAVVNGLVKMAKDHGYVPAFPSLSSLSTWSARPLQVSKLQHNGYDCGVWILWITAAVVRGYEYAPIEERDIPRFRKYVANLARTIPV
ncbi:hypothetical protein PQX77_005748 [Marasmius sp. AFHP31]|nr:hypothetical protein PQX77_005748 [Marasmius sp. AFHP31]